MISNSTSGLTLLPPEQDVTVVEEEHHQAVLARYAPPAGAMPRRVVVELHHAPVARGTHAGRPGVEILLDGHRVGELTHRMAQRYGPMVEQAVRRGERPGARAVVKHGRRGLVEVELRLPAAGTTIPEQRRGPVPPVPAAPGGPRKRRAVWIGGAAFTALVVAMIASGNSGSTPTTSPVTDVVAATAPPPPAAPVLTPAQSAPVSTSPSPTAPVSEAPPPVINTPEPAPATRAPVVPDPPAAQVPEPASDPAPEARDPEPAPAAAYYKNCTEARKAGVTPLHRGDPGYAPKLDRDNDGIACE